MSNTTHLTQCPSCQHQFNITDEQLGLKSGYARCGNCKKIFSAVDHLISPNEDTQSSLSQTATPVTSTAVQPLTQNVSQQANNNSQNNLSPIQTQKKSSSEDLDLLFDDHFGLDEDGTLIKTEPNQPVSKFSSKKKSIKEKDASEDFEIISNFDNLPTAVTGDFSKHIQETKEAPDEAWLTDLLEEDNKKFDQSQIVDNKLTTINRQSNDVTVMLEELGVDVKYETAPSNEEYLQKLENRIAGKTSSQSRVKTNSMGMTIIWAVGSLILAVALYTQYLIFNMNELVKDPSKAHQVTTLCSMVGCHPPLANEAAIEVNTLTLNPAKADSKKTDLIFTLKNTTKEVVLYPNLKFTLRQGNETKAQFVLSPQEYVDKETTSLVGGEIKPIKLRIDYPKSSFEQANIDVFY